MHRVKSGLRLIRFFKIMDERIGDGVKTLGRGGMHEESRRFVDDEQVLVFVDDGNVIRPRDKGGSSFGK